MFWDWLDRLVHPRMTIGPYRWREIGISGAIVLADPLDMLLTELSPAYLSAAWDRLQQSLPSARYRFASLHAGYSRAAIEHDDPLEFFGWSDSKLWAQAGTRNAERLDTISKQLLAGTPALQWAVDDARCWECIDVPGDDFEAGVEALIGAGLEGFADVHPVFYARRDTSELWRKICRAVSDGQSDATQELMNEAQRRYSPAGFRLMSAAVAHWHATGTDYMSAAEREKWLR